MTTAPTTAAVEQLAARVVAGETRAVARAITVVENESAASAALIGQLYAHTGRAYVVGITGAPGAGKSTLVDRLVAEIRGTGATVGVLAIDPSSPFTGGAILGDRVRMNAHTADDQVFIRSMATRGHLGGLARATWDAALVLDAAGKDVVLIETVGVGQDEVDVVRTADISVVVLVPGTGDDVQALKAGIMEIGDIFVVNKADHPGAERLAQAVTASLSLQPFAADAWQPPVLMTEATAGAGTRELWDAITRYRAQTSNRRAERERTRHAVRLRELLAQAFVRVVDERIAVDEFDRLVEDVSRRQLSPHAAVGTIMDRLIARATPR